MPAILISGGSFALLQFLTANFVGPALPDIIAGIGSIICLVTFLKFWKPQNSWRFAGENTAIKEVTERYTANQVITAWSPFLFLTIIILTWGIPSVKNLLNTYGQLQFAFPGLNNTIADHKGVAIAHIFKFNYLSAAGTAVFLAGLAAVQVIGLSYRDASVVFRDTIKQLKFPIITIMSVLGFAYLVNDSGITTTIALLLANTGPVFPFFAPILGWLGVFITGSDTASNALFSKLQYVTAQNINVAPVVTVAANCSGGVVGKMISPQSIAVAAAAGHLVGKESALFRFTVKHSFILLLVISLLVLGQAYWLKEIIPLPPASKINGVTLNSGVPGYIWLLTTVIILIVIVTTIKINSKKANPHV
ncbi:L-lactate permease [Mucilaginibacter ximonensis]|uniref:L-lactate permease n=1 Tax=Mucilaginibacter ximonensis TaxID=538021 RepID=A0ABW5YCF7_9SPHI